MPTIPSYAIDSTEMEELNKIKRQLYTSQASSFLSISESPATDPTDGGAETALVKVNSDIELNIDLLRNLIDSLKIDREMLAYETFSMSNVTAVKSNFKSNLSGLNKIISGINRLIREMQDIQPNFNYTELRTVNRFKLQMENLDKEVNSFYVTTNDIITYLHNDGLIQSKGYYKSGSYPGITKKVTENDINRMMDRLRRDEIQNGTLFQGDYDPANLDRDDYIAYENVFRQNAIFLLEEDTIRPGVDIPTSIETQGTDQKLYETSKINDQIKKINEPFKQIILTFYEKFVELTNLANSLTKNFNEARGQPAITVEPELKFGSSSNFDLEGSGYSHPSAREMAFYRKAGLPMYM